MAKTKIKEKENPREPVVIGGTEFPLHYRFENEAKGILDGVYRLLISAGFDFGTIHELSPKERKSPDEVLELLISGEADFDETDNLSPKEKKTPREVFELLAKAGFGFDIADGVNLDKKSTPREIFELLNKAGSNFSTADELSLDENGYLSITEVIERLLPKGKILGNVEPITKKTKSDGSASQKNIELREADEAKLQLIVWTGIELGGIVAMSYFKLQEKLEANWAFTQRSGDGFSDEEWQRTHEVKIQTEDDKSEEAVIFSQKKPNTNAKKRRKEERSQKYSRPTISPAGD